MSIFTQPGSHRRTRRHWRKGIPLPANLSIESLEQRSLLTSLTWTDTKQLTISFVPDGTDVAGNASQLDSMMSGIADQTAWRSAITSAFNRWLSEVGMALQVVSDSGVAFGVPGATSGDTRFGDVRVGAVPLSDNALATAIPANRLVSGTWAGDMLFNSNDKLTTLDEVYALALHEAGHVLGLQHSADPNSPMFSQAGTQVHEPTAADLQALRRLFGAGNNGSAQSEESDEANNEPANAERLTAIQTSGLNPRFEADGSITNSLDVDAYRFRPADLGLREDGTLTLVLTTCGNGLIPKVSLTTVDGRRVEGTVLANGNGSVVIQYKDISPKREYLVQVESAAKELEDSHGDYQLSLSFDQPATPLERFASGTLSQTDPQHIRYLYAAKSQVVNFVLSTKGSTRRPSAVVVSVYDESDQLIYRLAGKPGETVSGASLLLQAGAFRITFDVVAPEGQPLPELEYSFRGTIVSLDAGPLPKNPTLNPVYGGSGSGPYVYPNNVVSNCTINIQTPPAPPVMPPSRPPLVWNPKLVYYPWIVQLP